MKEKDYENFKELKTLEGLVLVNPKFWYKTLYLA